MTPDDPRANRPRFVPEDHISDLRNIGKYMLVVDRVQWLRSDFPDAVIETTAISVDENYAIFRAEVILPTGGRATAHAAQSAQQFTRGFIEKCEAKAVGRALAFLGYGTAFALEDIDEGFNEGVIADTPIQRGQPTTGGRAPQRPEPTAALPHAQPPTERMVKFARALQREVELSDEEFDLWCTELFGGNTFAQLNMPQVSALITALQRRKAERS